MGIRPERRFVRGMPPSKVVAQGLSNPDIAQRLVLSEHMIHRHVANILRELNLSSPRRGRGLGVRTGLA